MKSPVKKRSVLLHGHKTSVSLEDDFWDALQEIATSKGISRFHLVEDAYEKLKPGENLSSALRLLVLHYYRAAAKPARKAA